MKIVFGGETIFCVLMFAMPWSVFAQGSLTPPAAPAPTMKSLDQIASTGIAINATNTPGNSTFEAVISQPGNYYLAGKFGVNKSRGIDVMVANVTIDLNGFEIFRASGSGGIAVEIDANEVTIRHGSINGFDDGIGGNPSIIAGNFVDLSLVNCNVIGISAGTSATVASCRIYHGTNLTAAIETASGSSITDCVVDGCGGTEVILLGGGSRMSNCQIFGSNVGAGGTLVEAGQGSSVSHTQISGNVAGTLVAAAKGCSVSDTQFSNNSANSGLNDPDQCVVSNCTVAHNAGSAGSSSGINVGPGSLVVGCSVIETTATGTTSVGVGIAVGGGSTVADCTAANNSGDGFQGGDAVTFSHCTGTGNGTGGGGGSGVNAGLYTTVVGSTLSSNKVNGIQVKDYSHVSYCNASNNQNSNFAGSGITTGPGSTVDHCTANANKTAGITLGGASSVTNSKARGNNGDGINAPNDCYIGGNHCSENGQSVASAGIHTTSGGNRIVGNSVVFNNGTGIEVDGGANLITQNSARFHGVNNYVIAANNLYGPIVDLTTVSTAAVSGTNSASATTVSTDPQANFAY